MAVTAEITEKVKVLDRIADFLHRNRRVFLFIGLGLLVLLIGLIIFVEVQKRTVEKSAFLAEQIEKDYAAWKALTDQEEKNKKEGLILTDLESLITKYGGTYAAERAYMIRANIAFEKKEWEAAANSWIELSRKSPKSYLAPIALINAAAALEEKGDSAKSLEILGSIAAGYSSVFPEMPRVLFSIGRLSEAQGVFDAAAVNYNKIIDEYPSSSWTKLARNRIIYLKTQNKITK